MAEGMDFHVIRTPEELRTLSGAWSGLWREDPNATPFQSPEWLLPWWHQFGQTDLRAVAIFQRGKLTGLLPFYVYREPRTGDRQMLLLGAGTSDYLGGVFAKHCTKEHVQEAIRVACAQGKWDVLYASQLLPGSLLCQALERSARCSPAESCSRMAALPMSQLPQKIRRNAMYYRNRAARLGTLELTLADPSNWMEYFHALQRMHTARWQERGEPGVLADERVLAWHQEALPLLQQSGIVRLCSLRLNGEIIGVLYSLIDPPRASQPAQRTARTQYFYLTAYSMQHADLRPGTLLLALAIEQAANEGVQTIDMLRGDEAYKQIWHLTRSPTVGFALRNTASSTSASNDAISAA
ncbi:MAG TPA: GNAT family N-acetyltransferase [Acidobacteriaceae bacterium]|nr:GNAT family N-acetyltransferase [Acidobacteriaceae bacterium]